MDKMKVAKGYGVVNGGKCIIQVGQRGWPSIIYFIRGDKYDIYEMKSRNAYEKVLKQNVLDALDNIERGKGYESALELVQYVYPEAEEMDLQEIASDSMKSRRLPIYYPVYKASDFIKEVNSKNLDEDDIPYEGIKRKTLGVSKSKLYNFFVLKKKNVNLMFTEFFGALDIEENEFLEKYSFKGWDIMVEKKTKIDYDEVRELLTQTYKHLRSVGLGALCYGKMTAVNTLKSNVLAQYMWASDEIMLRTKGLKYSRDVVADMIHEVGHRFYLKKFSSAKKREVLLKFNQLHNDKPRSYDYKLNIHDLIKYKTEIYKLKSRKRNKWLAILVETTNSRKVELIGTVFEFPTSLFGPDGVLPVNNKVVVDEGSYKDYFISNYASTDHEEFFCELFSDWAMGGVKLKGEAFDWFDKIMS